MGILIFLACVLLFIMIVEKTVASTQTRTIIFIVAGVLVLLWLIGFGGVAYVRTYHG